MLTLQRLTVEDWQVFRRLRLSALAESPEAFGAALLDWSGRGDSELRWRARLHHVPYNAVARAGASELGMVSATRPDRGVVELISMWVAPAARGQGVADALVEGVVSWARGQAAHTLLLKVHDDNQHALAAYRRNGFVRAKQQQSRRDASRGEQVWARAL